MSDESIYDLLMSFQKHFSGQHDQKLHGNRGGEAQSGSSLRQHGATAPRTGELVRYDQAPFDPTLRY